MLARRFRVSATIRRSIGVTALALCSAGLAACKKKPPAPAPEPPPDDETVALTLDPAPSAAPSAGPVAARCREDSGKSFVIGEVGKSRGTDDEEDAGPDEEDEVPAPFSVELGEARAATSGFSLSALRSIKGQAHALLALVPEDAKNGKLVDLGAVHGDPDPPAFALHGADAVVAASDTDAGGGMLRLGLVQNVASSAEIHWGQEITGVRRDSTFALEVSGDRALLVYAAEASGKIRVYGALLDPANLKAKLAPEPLSAPGADVDSPRLALRKGGYWLAVARSLDAPKPVKKKPADAGADLGEDDSLLDIGTRRIEVQKLDEKGKTVSSALVVTAPGARPMAFDLAAASDGGAYIAFRADDSTPGADGGALELVHVKPDGTFQKLTLDGDANGTGTPSLLVDVADPSKVWLTAAGENGATWFGRVGDKTALAADSTVRGADVVAVRGGQFLLARSKSTAAELTVAQCHE